ncbi:hypothetical protein [Streptomyces chartreusis]
MPSVLVLVLVLVRQVAARGPVPSVAARSVAARGAGSSAVALPVVARAVA